MNNLPSGRYFESGLLYARCGPPGVLVDAILDAFQASGSSEICVSRNLRAHPRKFIVQAEFTGVSLWVYLWTLTHGGRNTLPNEYRIQMTSVASPLDLNPDGYQTIL